MLEIRSFREVLATYRRKIASPPRPEILSFVKLNFVILEPIEGSFVVHLKSDEILFVSNF